MSFICPRKAITPTWRPFGLPGLLLHVAADDAVSLLVHDELHQRLLITARQRVLHGAELRVRGGKGGQGGLMGAAAAEGILVRMLGDKPTTLRSV